MKLGVTIIIGLLVGILDGVGIMFDPDEPYKTQILVAATLNGIMVSLLIGYTMAYLKQSSWMRSILLGMLYGVLSGTVTFFAKGGFQSMDAPFVVPAGLVMGALTGVLLKRFSIKKD